MQRLQCQIMSIIMWSKWNLTEIFQYAFKAEWSFLWLTFVVKFGVSIPNTLGEINSINGNLLENMVTTLNTALNYISTIFPITSKMRYKFAVFSLRMRYLNDN